MSRHDGKVWVRKLRTGHSSHPWEVRARNLNGYDYYETFYDWADAMDYADRMARTREVVLPRPNSTWFEFPVWELGDGLAVHQSVSDKSLTVTADYPRMKIPNHKRRDYALALLALHYQQESVTMNEAQPFDQAKEFLNG